jgi:AcrR family transcriptional regulator
LEFILVGKSVKGPTNAGEGDTVEGGGRPLRADARRNRLKVIDAAQEVFSKHGPEARMEEVAEKAGVAVGTLYRHFPNKEALLGALIADRLGHVIEVARDVLNRDVEPWEGFSRVMRRLTGLAHEDRAFAHVVPLLGDEGEVGEAKRRVGALLEELVHKAQEAGKMRPDVGAKDLPPLFMGMVMATPPGFSPARQERYVQIILDGLRYQGTHEPG